MCCSNVRNTITTIRNRTTEPQMVVQRFSCRNVPVICDNKVSTKTVCTKVVPIVGTRFDVSHRKY